MDAPARKFERLKALAATIRATFTDNLTTSIKGEAFRQLLRNNFNSCGQFFEIESDLKELQELVPDFPLKHNPESDTYTFHKKALS